MLKKEPLRRKSRTSLDEVHLPRLHTSSHRRGEVPSPRSHTSSPQASAFSSAAGTADLEGRTPIGRGEPTPTHSGENFTHP